MMKYQEYNYTVGIYQFLLQSLEQTRHALQKAPGHVTHLATAEKIKNDIKLVEPLIKDMQTQLNRDLESKTGGKFQFLIQSEQKNGKIVKM